MDFDKREPVVYLSEEEEDATGFISPVLIAELTRDRIYAKFNEEHDAFQRARQPDNESIPRAPASLTDEAFKLKTRKQILDYMVVQLMEHQISLPSAKCNN